jgi:hypothetical protein
MTMTHDDDEAVRVATEYVAYGRWCDVTSSAGVVDTDAPPRSADMDEAVFIFAPVILAQHAELERLARVHVDRLAELHGLEAERDQLRAALEKALDLAGYWTPLPGSDAMAAEIKARIAELRKLLG